MTPKKKPTKAVPAQTDAGQLEAEDWRDLITSRGWVRFKTAFEQQWGNDSLVQTLETLANQPTPMVNDEVKRLLQVRVALRAFLEFPTQRLHELSRMENRQAASQSKPWTRADR